MDVHHRQLAALLVAALYCAALWGRSLWITHVIATWDVYAAVVLVISWVAILKSSPRKVSQTARLQDSGQTLIFSVVVAAAFVSLLAIIYLLFWHKNMSPGKVGLHIGLSVVAVVESWVMIHTIYALRYAHLYYRGDKDGSSGGLDFPGGREPNYLDFVYFSFVIGMTFQVSDVQVTTTRLRYLVLLQSLISFVFNTAILALSINIIAGIFAA